MRSVNSLSAGAVLSVLLIAGEPVLAQPKSVLGIEIGAPMSLPSCERVDPDGRKRRDLSAPCVAEADEVLPGWRLSFPTSEVPEWAAEIHAKRSPEGDYVDEVTIMTNGKESPADAIAMLTEKYGDPVLQISTAIFDRDGARFEARRAIWKNRFIVITYAGSTVPGSRGMIKAVSSASAARSEAERPAR